jgi:hypothetical protein
MAHRPTTIEAFGGTSSAAVSGMLARRCTATILFTLSALTTACAGPDEGDSVGIDEEEIGETGEEPEDEGEVPPLPPRQIEEDDGVEEPKHPGGIHVPAEPVKPVCEPGSSILNVGHELGTGFVTLSNSEDTAEITLQTTGSYYMLEAQVFIGAEPVPSFEGSVMPNEFPYQIEFEQPTDSWQLSIDLDEVGLGCGDQLNAVVHAVVVQIEDGVEVFEESAWVLGGDQNYAICCVG